MFNRTRPTFNTEAVGSLSLGPTNRVQVSLVDYLDNTSHKKWHCDLRCYVYSVKYKKWFPSQRGVVFSQRVLKELNTAFFNLPNEVPAMQLKETKLLLRIPKYKTVDLCLSVVGYGSGTRLDIRDFLKQETGYTGFSNKGVRVGYDMRNELSKILIECYNKMLDLEKLAGS